ncbi:MAG: AmmeMemoRadiSam system protein A [Deferribacterales bacterium]
MEISIIEKKILLSLARKTIYKILNGESTEPQEILIDILESFNNPINELSAIYKKMGCFVTLHIKKNLRGCIGTFREDKELYLNVHDMAIQAAFNDPRFQQLTYDEFDKIDIEISVLTPMTKITNLDEIVVGRDGLYVKKGFRSGVLLPQVATEYGWNKEEFLSYTCRKAGLNHDIWKYEPIEIYRFSAIIFSEKELN